jgi:hypothetical protein
MWPATIFNLHLVLGYVAWLLFTGTYILPKLKAMSRIDAQRAILRCERTARACQWLSDPVFRQHAADWRSQSTWQPRSAKYWDCASRSALFALAGQARIDRASSPVLSRKLQMKCDVLNPASHANSSSRRSPFRRASINAIHRRRVEGAIPPTKLVITCALAE